MLEPHRRNLEVPLPYMLTQAELVLDPVSHHSTLQENLEWIADNITKTSVLERVFRSTVLLYHSPLTKSASLGECLDTAIIWEVG